MDEDPLSLHVPRVGKSSESISTEPHLSFCFANLKIRVVVIVAEMPGILGMLSDVEPARLKIQNRRHSTSTKSQLEIPAVCSTSKPSNISHLLFRLLVGRAHARCRVGARHLCLTYSGCTESPQ